MSQGLNALVQLCENTIGASHAFSELFCFLQRVKATWITFLSFSTIPLG
jgi:hypothetical protein